MVPFFDLKRQYAAIQDEVKSAINGVLDSMMVTGGPFVEQFEEEFAQYCQAEACAAVNSGTSALHLALRALDIGEGDEVIVPANTFIATPWGASYVGATPVFVDCDPATWEIGLEDIKNAITPKTKAVMGVHLYGQPCQATAIRALCDERGIYFIEDAAQAHGALIDGKPIGTVGHLACFSFYPRKNLGTYGEGGAVVGNDTALIDRIKRLRNLGSAKKYYHQELGYNMRMGAMQAAVLSVKLKYLPEWTARRQAIAQRYFDQITNPAIVMQAQPENTASVFHLFVVQVQDREHFMEYMKAKGVGTAMHYPVPCHLQECYADLNYASGDFIHTEQLAANCVSLPMFPELTDSEADEVIAAVNAYAQPVKDKQTQLESTAQ